MAQPVENLEVQHQQQVREYERYIPPARIIPVWLKAVIMLILIVVVTVIGLMIGYGVIGNGEPLAVLKTETWQHIYQIVNP